MILQLELKLDRATLDHKIAMQEKDDIISEEKMNQRHKDSELREAKSNLDRVRDDIGFRIQEALNREQDRLSIEKQADIEAINHRNELLIKSLVDNHCAETRLLRNQLLNQERKQRDSEQLLINLEIELNHFKEDAQI